MTEFKPEISDVQFYCEYKDKAKSNLSCAIIYILIDNYPLPENDSDQTFFALAYGDSGGGTQGDWLFSKDLITGAWKYSDSTGDEWKGAKEISEGSHLYDQEVSSPPTWTNADSACLIKLNEYWDKYFFVDSIENINFSEKVFDQFKEGPSKAISEDFDWDILFDVSPIWNLLVQYKDPYYEN